MPHLSDIQIRDPFVIKTAGEYYLFGSTDPDIWKSAGIGFDCYRAMDETLTQWDGPIPAFRPGPDFFSVKNFWAPEVYHYQGDYYLFATFKPFTAVGGERAEQPRGTAILKSTSGSVVGPYEPWSVGENSHFWTVTPPDWETLDGTLFLDDSGAPWMVFCHEWQQIGDGTVEAMPLAADLRGAIGLPTTLFRASDAAWSAPLVNRAPGSYVTDGPFLYHDSRGYLKCLWSSFGPEGNYLIGEAVSVHDDGTKGGILGPWQQAPEPLFSADGGHGMLFTGPEERRYLAVHSPNKTPNERALFAEVVEGPASDDDGPAGWLVTTGNVIR